MSQKKKHIIRVVARRRRQPDTSRLARALIELAQAEAERAAEADHQPERRGDAV